MPPETFNEAPVDVPPAPETPPEVNETPARALSPEGMSAMQGFEEEPSGDGQTVDAAPPAPSPDDDTYARPTHFRAGVRDEVWSNARDAEGNVYDPGTGELMDKNKDWDMGHKPGYEFRKHQESAAERGISREKFLDEYNNPDHYRPELPSSNRSHKYEDQTDAYFGD